MVTIKPEGLTKDKKVSYNIKTFFLLFPKIGRNYCKKVPKTQLRLAPQSVHYHARQYTVSCLTLKIYLHQLPKKKIASGFEKSCLALPSLLSFRVSMEVNWGLK